MTLAIDQEISIQLDASRTLWLTEISRQTFYDQGLESLESDDGLFLALENITDGTFQVLAKVASATTGMDLLNLMASEFKIRAI